MRSCHYILTALLSIILLAGCSDECLDNRNALPYAGLYDTDNPGSTLTISELEVWGVGSPGDSLLVTRNQSITSVYLPFRIDSDTTDYIFRRVENTDMWRDELTSKVRFIYSRSPRFVSAACGVSYQYDIRKIEWEGSLIDSVACPDGFITNENIENLKIYISSSALE